MSTCSQMPSAPKPGRQKVSNPRNQKGRRTISVSSPITSRGLLIHFYAIEFLAPLMEESDDDAGPTVTKASKSNAIKSNDESKTPVTFPFATVSTQNQPKLVRVRSFNNGNSTVSSTIPLPEPPSLSSDSQTRASGKSSVVSHHLKFDCRYVFDCITYSTTRISNSKCIIIQFEEGT